MTWQDLLKEGRIERHKTSRAELTELRGVVARDLADAEVGLLSADRRFATAYNAALQSAKMVIACCGYRVRGSGAHQITFECLNLGMGKPIYKIARFLDQARRKRNIADYDAAGRIADIEVEDMIRIAKSFAGQAEQWIRQNYPEFGES
jgi:uncharacterized protein (UPF0332 family)